MDSPNFQFQTETEYKDGDKGTGAWAIKPGPAEIPEVPGDIFAEEDFEGTLWSQITFFGGDWSTTATEAHNGTLSFTNADIDDSGSSSFFISNDVGATQLSFWLKTDTETDFDQFKLFIDFVEVFSESGPTDWQLVEIPLAAAFELIEFRYEKDSSVSAFSDSCFVDEIILGTEATPGVPARPFVYTPLKMTDDGECQKVFICGIDETIAPSGVVNTRFLDCETDSVTICPPVSGTFDVEILNEVDIRNLDCSIDSVTVCPPVSGTFNVEIINEVDIRNLDCITDSITVCPPASGSPPFNVEVVNEVDIRNLDCTTDSITICPPASGGQPFEVTIIDQPIAITGRALDCALDSVTICTPVTGIEVTILDQPVAVTGLVTTVPGRRTLRGLYYGSSGAIAYTTAADAATGGDLWIVNTSSTVVAYIREIRFTSNIASLALLTALPRINMERMTFTGTPSGAQITPAKRDSLDPSNTATVRTAATGMTITAGAVIKSFSPPSSDVIGGLLAANASSAVPVEQIFVGDIDSFIVLRQNEGIVFRQANAGSATENRLYNIDFTWEEI